MRIFLQKHAVAEPRPAFARPLVQEAARSHGRQLDPATRAFMEPRFGYDFSQVRVHSDSRAAESAAAMSARAYTIGRQIYFGAGQFQPGTREGDRLMAHELAHTLQQGPSGDIGAQAKLEISQPGDPAEREADTIAGTVMSGNPVPKAGRIPVGATREAIARAALKTHSGVFKVDNYAEVDPDKNMDTDKSVGAAIDIAFTPAESVTSAKISFVQIMKTLSAGSPYLFENEKPRATQGKHSAGWALDRLDGKKSANYGQENDGSAGGNTRFGHRNGDADVADAWMHDEIGLPRAQGKTLSSHATTFALDNTNGKYLGALSWGFTTDATGKTTKKNASVFSAGDPAGVQKRALKKWNAQANLADIAKRNAPDQEKVPLP